jgi:3-oxosteroid 1-dehydrogenase
MATTPTPRTQTPRPDSFDLIVIGGGLGGLATAIRAADAGASVLVIEKSDKLGGVAASSGGGLYAPCTRFARNAGIEDSLEAAETYLDFVATVPHMVDRPMRRALLERMAPAVEYLADLGAQMNFVPKPDQYYPQAEGALPMGRLIEVWVDRSQRDGLPIPVRGGRHFRTDVTQNQRLKPARPTTGPGNGLVSLGPGLVGALACIAMRYPSVAFMMQADVLEILRDADRAAGVLVEHEGQVSRIASHRGVVLATGSYGGRTDSARTEGLPEIVEGGCEGLTGDAITLAAPFAVVPVRAGLPSAVAGITLSIPTEDGETEQARTVQAYRSLARPHSLVVNQAGLRFADESFYPYLLEGLCRFDSHQRRFANFPSFWILDQQFKDSFDLTEAYEWDPGLVAYPDLDSLAKACGIDPLQFRRTIDIFNRDCESGIDTQFQRGSNEYAKSMGAMDDRVARKNPTLGSIAVAPFYALRLRLMGTGRYSMGLPIDALGRVRRADGEVVQGLYATGNATALTDVFGYIGGLANSRNVVYGFAAADHALGRATIFTELAHGRTLAAEA